MIAGKLSSRPRHVAAPTRRTTRFWISSHEASAARRRPRPRAVNVTVRVRRSFPAAIVTSPCRASGPRLRVKVVRSITKTSANRVMVGGSANATATRIGNWVARIPLDRYASSNDCVTTRVILRKLTHAHSAATLAHCSRISVAFINTCIYTNREAVKFRGRHGRRERFCRAAVAGPAGRHRRAAMVGAVLRLGRRAGSGCNGRGRRV